VLNEIKRPETDSSTLTIKDSDDKVEGKADEEKLRKISQQLSEEAVYTRTLLFDFFNYMYF
jgi:hypothetical protein